MAKKERIALIDALRGLAISGILLLHHIEHFDFYQRPKYTLDWLITIDQWVWDKLFLLVSGKAFALFSLLFGVSFWIIHENRKARGESYVLRHFWRMFLLLLIGAFHIVFFRGDILMMYAVIGIPLVVAPYLSKKLLLGIAILLLINPLHVYTLVSRMFGGEVYDYRMQYPNVNVNKILAEGSFLEVIKMNFTAGYMGSIVWTWNVGRFFTIPGLFFLGVYFGRIKAITKQSLKYWYTILWMSIVGWLVFNLVEFACVNQIEDNTSKAIFVAMIAVYSKLSALFFVLSLIIVLWSHNDGKVWVARFCDFGRMGLTNYILMSVIGAVLYYGWGFGLYQYCGAFFTLCIAIAVLILQMKLSSWWLRKYGQGPLERLWRKLTWLKINKE